MHLWFVSPLAQRLGTGNISELQSAQYFFASSLLILIQGHYNLWLGGRSGWLFHFELLALAAISLGGVLQAWKSNGGRQFVLKAVCLSVPAGVQVFVLSTAFGHLLYANAHHLFDYQTFRRPETAYEMVNYTAFVGFSIYFWYLIYRGMGIAALAEARAGENPT